MSSPPPPSFPPPRDQTAEGSCGIGTRTHTIGIPRELSAQPPQRMSSAYELQVSGLAMLLFIFEFCRASGFETPSYLADTSPFPRPHVHMAASLHGWLHRRAVLIALAELPICSGQTDGTHLARDRCRRIGIGPSDGHTQRELQAPRH